MAGYVKKLDSYFGRGQFSLRISLGTVTHQQHLVEQALHLRVVGVCHCKGWRRARDPTTDWVLAQCPVPGSQTSFYFMNNPDPIRAKQLQAETVVTGA